MDQIKISQSEVIFYIALINIVIGFFLGTFPLLAGFIAKNRKYGIYGFIGSVVGGGILGILLSYPIAMIFIWLIVKKAIVRESADSISIDEKTAELSVENSENS